MSSVLNDVVCVNLSLLGECLSALSELSNGEHAFLENAMSLYIHHTMILDHRQGIEYKILHNPNRHSSILEAFKRYNLYKFACLVSLEEIAVSFDAYPRRPHIIREYPWHNGKVYISRKISEIINTNQTFSNISHGADPWSCGRAVKASFSWAKRSEFDPSLGHQCWGVLLILIYIGYV